MIKLIGIFLLFMSCVVNGQQLTTIEQHTSQIEQVSYYYLGTFNAIVGIPAGKGPFPVIIYSYDEVYDWAGEQLAGRMGYSLEGIARYFSQKGYLCLIPIKRYRKVNAILGVTDYLKKVSIANLESVHLVGMSEGAFFNMMVAQKRDIFKTMTVIAPIRVNDKGYLSADQFLYKELINTDMPILFLFVYDAGWRINQQLEFAKFLDLIYDDITFKRFKKEKRWFYSVNRYGNVIDRFILKYNLKMLHESTQSYESF